MLPCQFVFSTLRLFTDVHYKNEALCGQFPKTGDLGGLIMHFVSSVYLRMDTNSHWLWYAQRQLLCFFGGPKTTCVLFPNHRQNTRLKANALFDQQSHVRFYFLSWTSLWWRACCVTITTLCRVRVHSRHVCIYGIRVGFMSRGIQQKKLSIQTKC